MNDLNDFEVGDRVIVSSILAGYEFSARVDLIYPEGCAKYGLILVVDEDDDAWDVEPSELVLEDEDDDAWDVEPRELTPDDEDDEPDPFRNDAEADADALIDRASLE